MQGSSSNVQERTADPQAGPGGLLAELTALRADLVRILKAEADCLRQALEIFRTAGQNDDFQAAMLQVELTRQQRGAIVKRIHQLEGRQAQSAQDLPPP